jgi:hypothetical protein
MKNEIHGQLGSTHAMNFGRNQKHLEVQSASDAKSWRRAQFTSMNNCESGWITKPESPELNH